MRFLKSTPRILMGEKTCSYLEPIFYFLSLMLIGIILLCLYFIIISGLIQGISEDAAYSRILTEWFHTGRYRRNEQVPDLDVYPHRGTSIQRAIPGEFGYLSLTCKHKPIKRKGPPLFTGRPTAKKIENAETPDSRQSAILLAIRAARGWITAAYLRLFFLTREKQHRAFIDDVQKSFVV